MILRPKPERAALDLALGIALGLALLGGCDDSGGRGGAPLLTECGQGAPTIELGFDHPFRALDGEVIAYPIEQGFQGGFHIEVSVRVRGSMDPDHFDADLRLYVGAEQRARHVSPDTLYWLNDGACDYNVARMVLLDGKGGFISDASGLAPLLDSPVVLRIDFDSNSGRARGEWQIALIPPN